MSLQNISKQSVIDVSLFAQHCHSRAILGSAGLQTDRDQIFCLQHAGERAFVIGR